jgi:hypothetical protein
MTTPTSAGAAQEIAVSGTVRNAHVRLVVPASPAGWTTVATNIQHTPGGGYRVRQRVGKKRITVGVFSTLAEAVAIQTAALEAVQKQEAKGHPTLKTWLPTWLERREASRLRSVDSERNREARHPREPRTYPAARTSAR